MANTRAQVLAEETAAQDRSSLRVLVTSELQNEFSEQVKEVRSVCQNHYGGYRINFPRFNGVRLSDWLFKAEQFFSLDMTPDDLKVKVASSHFDDLAATWHQSIEELILWKHVKHDWVTYKLLLEGKYNKHVEDSIAELKQLQETEGIEEYHAHFELTSTRVELAEDYLVSLYLTGLQKDTQMNVRMFQPKSIQQCLMIGRLYETAHRKKSPTPDCYDCKTSDLGNQREAGTVVGMENLLQQQEVICEQTHPQKLVTTETVAATGTICGTKSIEILELSDVSLELDLHEAVCSSRGEITSFILEMVDWCEQPTSVKTKHCAHQCFDKWPTMAMVQQKKPKEKSLKCWKFKFKPEKEDMHQQHNQIFYVFNCGNNIGFDHHEKELHVFDGVVMNVSFQHSTCLSSRLQSKKKQNKCPKSWMFKYKEMSFKWGMKTVQLHGLKQGSIREVKAAKLNKLREGEAQLSRLCVQHIPEENELMLCSLETQHTPEEVKPEMGQLVEEFVEIFEEPPALPPFKHNHNHRIPLMTGSNSINQRPKLVRGFGVFARPLHDLIKKDSFLWNEDAQQSFERLKVATMVLVKWTTQAVEEATWEYPHDLQRLFPSFEP